MKFFFSLALLLFNSVQGSPLILITFDSTQRSLAKSCEKILKEKFYLTKEMYLFREVKENPCAASNALATQLCLKNKEIRVVFRNEEVMNEMLGVFWK